MSLCLARRALRTASFRTVYLCRPTPSISRTFATEQSASHEETGSPQESTLPEGSVSSDEPVASDEPVSPTASFSRKEAAPRDSISPGLGTTNDDIEYYTDILGTTFQDDDTPSAGHLMLREQRQVLYYLRLIEHEMPKLVAYRKPFVPPPNSPLVVRSINYAGEEHPATAKRVVVAAVNDLPLNGKDAIHRIKVLAGPRWTPNPPADGGISGLDEWKNGYIKIACEDFPEPAMNLKWASDTMDRLVAHANNPKHNLKDVPVDLRHVYAKARKAKKGEHTRSRVFARPSILDFPLEWIPERRRKYALS